MKHDLKSKLLYTIASIQSTKCIYIYIYIYQRKTKIEFLCNQGQNYYRAVAVAVYVVISRWIEMALKKLKIFKVFDGGRLLYKLSCVTE